ncbi:MAG: hypothetical protein B7Z66_06430 [Chromatiales bacterium 21-64-14]|nr:MAG: hypothetical protein B7Z66_06430 [Chromatiales bacterium 21-64-14]HQU16947.1 lysophospholipase [Gammaproteobacteria bacterium]
MEPSEGTFRGADGVELHYRRWRPEDARAVLVIMHGISEHSGRYANVVNAVVPQGYAVYGFDLRGHGRSPGQRGYIESWREYREDLAAFITRIAEWEPHLPRFLLGHSMGGVIALDYCLEHPQGVSGVIASAPALGEIRLPRVLWALAHVMHRFWPRFSVRLPLSPADVSRDPAVMRDIDADPLIHSQGSARLGIELQRAARRVQERAREFRVPLLIVHGGADRLVPLEGSRRFMRHVLFPDKELLEYAGGYHELYNDIIRDQVLADTLRWLERHLPEHAAQRAGRGA